MKQRELLERNLDELRRQLEEHRRMLQTALDGGALEEPCRGGDCRHRQLLLSLLAETARTLDETRKAFKSKPLEQLRLRLLRVLSEEAGEMAKCG